MESLAAAEGSDSNNNNNNTEESNTAITTDFCVSVLPQPQLQNPFFLDLSNLDPAPACDLPAAESFAANPALLETLTEEHGFSDVASRKALYWTKNQSLESAILWLCDRDHSTYETPLEEEVEQMKEEVERINHRAMMSQLKALNPDISYSLYPADDFEEMLSYSEEQTEEEELEFVVLLNSRSRRRMLMGSQMIKFVKEAVKDLVYNLSLTSTATDQFDAWEEGRGGGTTDVLVGWAEGSPHLTDLELCARSLSLHTGVAGLRWDPLRLCYRDYIALAVWGNATEVQKAVGRLIPVSARK